MSKIIVVQKNNCGKYSFKEPTPLQGSSYDYIPYMSLGTAFPIIENFKSAEFPLSAVICFEGECPAKFLTI